jgi:hypothetical protein
MLKIEEDGNSVRGTLTGKSLGEEEKKKFWEEQIAYVPLIRNGQHRKLNN